MKINRVALRGAVQKTLDAAETQHAEQVKAWEQWFEDYQTKWIDKWNPQWASAIDVIRLAITKGRVITDDMLPTRNGHIETYAEPYDSYRSFPGRPPKPAKAYVPSRELLALREVLDLITDEEVTPTGLAGIGITPKTLREAIQYMGQGSVKA